MPKADILTPTVNRDLDVNIGFAERKPDLFRDWVVYKLEDPTFHCRGGQKVRPPWTCKSSSKHPTSFRALNKVPEALVSSNCADTNEPPLTSLALLKISLSSLQLSGTKLQ